MPKRTRARPRTRREPLGAGRVTPAEREERESVRTPRRSRTDRGGQPRAIGEPSPVLERAGAWERGFVMKDFRRLAITIVAIMAVMLLSGFVASNFVR